MIKVGKDKGFSLLMGAQWDKCNVQVNGMVYTLDERRRPAGAGLLQQKSRPACGARAERLFCKAVHGYLPVAAYPVKGPVRCSYGRVLKLMTGA